MIFWLSPKLRYLSITCPKDKYHAAGISLRKQYHAAGISLPQGNKVSLPGDCHVALLLAMTECVARNTNKQAPFWVLKY